MPNPTSAPTTRVLDVLDLLSQPGVERLRFNDIARELGLAQGTAHAILNTLTARGWIDRDPHDKRYSIGNGLSLLAVRVQAGRTLANAVAAASRSLAAETGMLVSITERVGDEVAIVAYEGGEPGGLRGNAGESIPYAPPFGLGFAAWDEPEEQRAWIERTTATPEVVAALDKLLAATVERGYTVEWMTDVMAEVAEILPALGSSRGGTVSKIMRRVMDELLLEYVGPESHQFASTPDPTTPVIVISAPVFDENGRVAFGLSLHPLQPLSQQEIARLGGRLSEVCRNLVEPAQSTGMS